MGIFTSQKRNLSDLPKPASFDFGSVNDLDISGIDDLPSSVPKDIPMEPKKEELKSKKQIFVKMEHYKEALDTISKIREKVKDADSVLNNIRTMKSSEDQHLEKWHRDLEIIKEKLNNMDQILYDIEHE